MTGADAQHSLARAAVVIEPVSANNLYKTGISPDAVGDFWPIPSHDREIGSLETKPNAQKARISGPVRHRLQTVAKLTHS
jgi:hypothetical protein